MMIELEDAPRNTALMRVIGVGGAGGNAVNRMIEEELEGVDFISANTDAQALNHSKAPHTIQLGKKLTRGLGAGARPGIGRQAVAEDAGEVRVSLDGADLVFIAAGMGGGTGTGAAPVIGEIARELGALTIAVVSRPFSFEGKRRMRQAEQGLAELRRTVDTMVVVPNDRLLPVVGKGTTFREALKKADEVLLNATKGISDLIRVSGDVNVDFADVRTVMSSCGAALMGTGYGRGEDRAITAAQDAITSPLPGQHLDPRSQGRPDQHHRWLGPHHRRSHRHFDHDPGRGGRRGRDHLRRGPGRFDGGGDPGDAHRDRLRRGRRAARRRPGHPSAFRRTGDCRTGDCARL